MLIEKHQLVLCDFIASLIGRSVYHIEYFRQILQGTIEREVLFDYITFSQPKYRRYFDYPFGLLDLESQIRIIRPILVQQYSYMLQFFKFIILEPPPIDDRQWFTSDNPIVISNLAEDSNLLTQNTELYFPLSKKYCLYLFHNDGKDQTTTLRQLKPNKIKVVGLETFEHVQMKIGVHNFKYLIIPKGVEIT